MYDHVYIICAFVKFLDKPHVIICLSCHPGFSPLIHFVLAMLGSYWCLGQIRIQGHWLQLPPKWMWSMHEEWCEELQRLWCQVPHLLLQLRHLLQVQQQKVQERVQEVEKYISFENHHPHMCYDTFKWYCLNPIVSAAILVIALVQKGFKPWNWCILNSYWKGWTDSKCGNAIVWHPPYPRHFRMTHLKNCLNICNCGWSGIDRRNLLLTCPLIYNS